MLWLLLFEKFDFTEMNCDATGVNRSKCRKCRYIKCIANGMDPNWVLNMEQTRKKFKNDVEQPQMVSF
jgi:hypothetical protein